MQNNPVYLIQNYPACCIQHGLVYKNRTIELVYRMTLFIRRQWSSLYTELRLYKEHDPACIQNYVYINKWSGLYTEWRCLYKQNDPAYI